MSDCSTSTFLLFHNVRLPLHKKSNGYKSWRYQVIVKKCYMYIGSFSMKLLYTCIFKVSSPSKAPADGLVSIKR
jgi:hypothetical protein